MTTHPASAPTRPTTSSQSAPGAQSDDGISRLVKGLAADSFEVRQESERRLIEIGPAARAAVEEALRSNDAEVRIRAKRILAAIETGSLDKTNQALRSRVLWELRLESRIFEVVAGDGFVYFLTDDRTLCAASAASGKIAWKCPLPADATGPPALCKGVVCVSVGGSGMLAVNAVTGKVLWSLADGHRFAHIRHDGRTIYVNWLPGGMLALDPTTGKEKWRYEGFKETWCYPCVGNGAVYLAGEGNRFLALSAETGRTLWSATVVQYVAVSPVVAGGTVYLGTMPAPCTWATIQAFDANTGLPQWNMKVPMGRTIPLGRGGRCGPWR